MAMATPPLLLLLDWDGTLTTTSTLPLIASIATFPKIHPQLAALSTAYADDWKTHDEHYRPRKTERNTIAQELAYLNSLRPVERASVERIETAGLFRDVGTEDVDRAAKGAVEEGAVRLRDGFVELGRRVRGRGGRVGIVSVAWSRRFINGVISKHAQGLVGDVDVRANEIEGGGEGALDRVFGDEEGGVWSAGDKVRVVGDFVGAAAAGLGEGEEALVPWVVYVGDSTTDLACLIRADTGVCIRDAVMTGEQGELRGTLERIGVECLHVGLFGEERVGDGSKKRLWWARDFEEVARSGVVGKLPEKVAV